MLVGTVVTVLSVIVPAFRGRAHQARRGDALDRGRHVGHLGGPGACSARCSSACRCCCWWSNQFVGAQWYYLAPGGLLLFVSLFVAGPLLARGFALVATRCWR